MTHAIVSLVFLILLALVANPFDFWMPTAQAYLTVAAIAVVGALYAGLVYKEGTRDEREAHLRSEAARLGYIVGIVFLIAGIAAPILQGGHPSLWVVGALAAMVVARIASRGISE